MDFNLPIIAKIPDNFLYEEVRSEYTVSVEKKQLWAVELDLLIEFMRVCEKHHLHWCAGAGTLLGAVRHQGFIPWDDDVDIYMIRSDYDKLLSYSDEFEFPYFLQFPKTEGKLLRTHAQLRNSKTTGFIDKDLYLDINKGIFIDIFPIDGVENDGREIVEELKNRIYREYYNWYMDAMKNYPYLPVSKRIKRIIKKVIIKIVKKDIIYNRYEANLKKFSTEKTKIWGNRTLVYKCPKSRRPLEDFLDTIDAPFEFITIKIPKNYNSILQQQYGDYMKYPSNKNGTLHGHINFSAVIPYNEYKKV